MEDSNLFSLFASLWYLVSGLIRLKRNAPASRTAKRMRYAAACMVSIYRIREKIEDNPREPRLITTIRGLGYRFEAGNEEH